MAHSTPGIRRISSTSAHPLPRLLEVGEMDLPVAERLLAAANRTDGATPEPAQGAFALRRDQHAVFLDFTGYRLDVATTPLAEQRPPFGRIVQPPRTGKTVVAAHLLGAEAAAGLEQPSVLDVEQLEQATREARDRGEVSDLWSGAWRAACGGDLDDPVPTPEELLVAKRRIQRALWLIDLLKPRSREAIRSRLGLDDGIARTGPELAALFDVSRSRMAQIMRASIEKLRYWHQHPLAAQIRRQALDREAARRRTSRRRPR